VKRFLAILSLALATLALPVLAGAAGDPGSDSATGPKMDTASALVQLNGAPLATYEKTKPPKGKKIDFSSSTVKSYRAQLSKLRNDFKQWLRANARSAKVTGEFDIALNAVAVELNGTTLDTLRSAPMVVRAEHQGLYYPAAHGEDPDLELIDAFEAWGGQGASSTAGAGVKVAIIDTGIDPDHPCFTQDGDGTPGDPFTNNKVLDAGVYYNKNQRDGFSPEDVNGHGTHVAGTVACAYHTSAEVNGVEIPYGVSGVAPAAKLGNFNVFPDQVESARSEDIMNALEDALEKGYDVANMSLSGGSSGIQDLLSMAVDAADEANMVVAVAAANDGPNAFTAGSPGIAPRALTAGASTVGHFVGPELTVAGSTYGLAVGDFAVVDEDTTAELGVVTGGPAALDGLNEACSALPADSLDGMIAVISRGTCTFSQKILNAQNAGAAVVIVVNNVAGDPTAMGLGGLPTEPTVPAYMVGLENRDALIAADGEDATVTEEMSYFNTDNDDIRAGFSAQGPTDVDFRVKPDVMAPGVNVLSAQPGSICTEEGEETPEVGCWAFFQGTSMATPHLAGSAAVVLSKHPTWSAAQVRSAIVNTADQGVVTSHTDGTTVLTDPTIIGSGRENLNSAVNAKVALDPVSVSFGGVPSGAGQTRTFTVQLSDLGGAGAYGASVAKTSPATQTGVEFTASVSGSTVTVTMSAAKGASAGEHYGVLTITRGGAEVAHAAVYALVK
jgi:subtilisin family serine protease